MSASVDRQKMTLSAVTATTAMVIECVEIIEARQPDDRLFLFYECPCIVLDRPSRLHTLANRAATVSNQSTKTTTTDETTTATTINKKSSMDFQLCASFLKTRKQTK